MYRSIAPCYIFNQDNDKNNDITTRFIDNVSCQFNINIYTTITITIIFIDPK